MEIELKEKNYYPSSIGFFEGFYGPKGNVGFFMLADYEKAKLIIETLVSSERKIKFVDMGLDGDWNENSMTIYKDETFTEYDQYCGSQWAEPLIIVYFEDGQSEAYSVWKREDSVL